MRKIIKKIISVSLLKKKYIKEYITRSSNPALTINEANKIIKELVGGFIYE
jgi:hypothetical protein